FFFLASAAPRDLHSFPTRRSSDLSAAPANNTCRGQDHSTDVGAGDGGYCALPIDSPSHQLLRALRRRTKIRRQDSAHTAFQEAQDRKSTRLNSSHVAISYAVFCLK